MKAKIGQIVYYKPWNVAAEYLAALVTEINVEDSGVVSLAVFSDNGILFRQNIPQGNDKGCWYFPDQPKD